ncbi:MAG TPA: hypothetical protein VIY53_12490 [Acidobacteriaceae bacterium]
MNRNQAGRAPVSLAWMLALSTVAFAAATPASATTILQSGSPYAEEATQVSVELSKGIDSRSSRPGQEVTAKIVAEARLADGATLPKGSKLVGHITAVQPSTRENPNGQIAVLFDHGVARDGHPIPVHALLLGMRMPPHATPPPMSGTDVTGMGRGGMATPGMAGAGANGPGAGIDGPGVNGGPPSGTSPESAPGSGPASGPGPVNMPPASSSIASAPGASVGPAGSVAGLPGVTWGNVAVGANGANSAANAGPPPPGSPTAVLFNGQGRNVTIDGGAQMVFAVTPQASAPQPAASQQERRTFEEGPSLAAQRSSPGRRRAPPPS